MTMSILKRGALVLAALASTAATQPGALTLDGATIASIYLGEIAKWNDSRIKQLNPKLALPDLAIAPIYRSPGRAHC